MFLRFQLSLLGSKASLVEHNHAQARKCTIFPKELISTHSFLAELFLVAYNMKKGNL